MVPNYDQKHIKLISKSNLKVQSQVKGYSKALKTQCPQNNLKNTCSKCSQELHVCGAGQKLCPRIIR